MVFLFDIGGVVLENGEPTSPDHASVYSEIFGIAPNQLKAAWHQPWRSYRIGAITEDEFWRQYLTGAGAQNVDISRAKALQREFTVPVRENIALLDELKQQGKRLAALTNISHEWLAFQRHAFNLDQYFSPIIASCKIGLAKPDEAMFQYALKVLKTQAADVVYVDNMADKVAAAQQLGMTAILYENPTQLRQALTPYL